MVYLDYSATTPVDEDVLASFCTVSKEYIGNPNSLHQLGVESKKLMDSATHQVAELLGVSSKEIIFTSSASEANSMALVGVVEKYPQRGKHILTTQLEHSSTLETVLYLKKKGYEIEYLPLDENGRVLLSELEKRLRKDTILVSVSHVSSEIGVVQDIDAMAEIIHQNPTTIFHVDGTQAVGKIPISLKHIDLYTMSGHKIYGLKGIACLVKKEKILMEPLIHGGKSQTIYRSGTPALALIVSFAKALRISVTQLDIHREKVKKRWEELTLGLQKFPITLNTNPFTIFHIVNLSLMKIKPETMLHALEQEKIYISTKTACSTDTAHSLSLVAMGKSDSVCTTSIRVSLSHLTTEKEIQFFLEVFEKKLKELTLQ